MLVEDKETIIICSLKGGVNFEPELMPKTTILTSLQRMGYGFLRL